jgi:hypothetical protein
MEVYTYKKKFITFIATHNTALIILFIYIMVKELPYSTLYQMYIAIGLSLICVLITTILSTIKFKIILTESTLLEQGIIFKKSLNLDNYFSILETEGKTLRIFNTDGTTNIYVSNLIKDRENLISNLKRKKGFVDLIH